MYAGPRQVTPMPLQEHDLGPATSSAVGRERFEDAGDNKYCNREWKTWIEALKQPLMFAHWAALVVTKPRRIRRTGRWISTSESTLERLDDSSRTAKRPTNMLCNHMSTWEIGLCSLHPTASHCFGCAESASRCRMM
ncbi:hypothetical protein H2248_000479 [Termitomyces sp. 'cryptogamus']|nr:hypothetical protein H2248_000479 [Termitomyces sp. 'cryptogamus']